MMQYKHLLLLTILVSTCYSQTTEPSPAEYRLNELHKPTSYTIEIIPYLTSEGTNAELTFDSSVSILFIAKAANNYIRLNAAESLIFDKTKTSLTIVGGVQIPITNTVLTTNPKTEILTLNLGSPLEVDKTYRLFFEYKGSIAEDMKGFYRSSYNESGVTVLLGSTQFQPTYARKVFPCWDEPNYKAIFTLSVIKPVEYGVISNTKESTTVPVGINGLKNKVTFESTPEMSTYLLAFIISKFTRRPSDSFSVWARPDQYKQTEYSFQVGKLLVTEMGNYLDSPYSAQLNKMDMAAIPDFSAGAMENWGLLTYRETALLYDEQDTPLLRKQYIAAVVAHEIAHMWFGDLVTCDWWEHIWLNEGFATYFEYFATSKVEKQFEMEKQFTIEIRRALLFDSTGESHPLSHPVVTQEQAMNIFDVIVYEKAAAVIRMMEHMIGSVAFQTGLKTYISTFAKKNVIPSDLLTHLFTVNVNMATYFNSWITKKGYPMIYVAFDENRSQATITQKHFTLDGGLDETIKYPIPLTFTVKSGDFSNVTPKPEHIFTEDKADMKISIDGKNWVIFNNQQSGFYRVNYDQKSWDLIQTALNLPEHDGIDEINRAQIVDDLFNFARAGVVTYTFALEFMEYLPQENQYLPWQTASESFAFISSRLPTGDLPKFRAYVNDITNNIFVKLGFGNKGTHLDIYNRANVINWACKSGNLQCISTANEYFSLYRDEGFKIPVNIRAPILCTAMRQGNMTDFNFMWSEYLNADVSTEKTTLLNAFGCAQDPDILQALLLEIFTNSDVRTQDKRAAFNSIFTNSEENLDYVLDYVTKNHVKVDNGFKGGKSELIKTLTQLAARFTTASQHKIYKDFVEAQKTYFDADQLLMLDVSATVDKNLAWIEKNKPDIMNYIEKRSKGSGATEIKSFSVVLLITSFVLILTNILQ